MSLHIITLFVNKSIAVLKKSFKVSSAINSQPRPIYIKPNGVNTCRTTLWFR